jgi:hypothetical protein
VGYDTAVIGGTMALTSFQRDFNMQGMAKTQRDTTQGNIVSTFQVSHLNPSLNYHPKHLRLAVSSALSLPSPSPNASAANAP